MEITKQNTSITDRDPNIYLGIDGTGILKNKFYHRELYECGFYVLGNSDLKLKYSNEYFYILHNNPNIYLTEEDLKIPLLHIPSEECNDNNYKKGWDRAIKRKEGEPFDIFIPSDCNTTEKFEEILNNDVSRSFKDRHMFLLLQIHIKNEDLWVSLYNNIVNYREEKEEKEKILENKLDCIVTPEYGTLIRDF